MQHEVKGAILALKQAGARRDITIARSTGSNNGRVD
jgi:hypothetical protein